MTGVLLITLLLGAPPPSAAALALAVPPAAGDELAELQVLATQALLADPKLRAVDAAAADPAGDASRAAAAREGEAKMQAGRAAFDNLDLPGAAKLFAQAAELFAAGGGRAPVEPYVQALLWQAASRWVGGDHDSPGERLSEVFTLAPGLAIDRALFPPDFAEEADRVRADAVAAPPVEFTVRSTPAGFVWVDGRFQGATPATVKLSSGPHFFAVAAAGCGLAVLRSAGPDVTLAPKPSATAAWLSAAREALGRSLDSPGRAAALAAAREKLGTDEIVVLALEGTEGGRTVEALRVAADGHVLGFSRQPVETSVAATARAALAELLARDLPRGPGGRPVKDTGLSRPGFPLHLRRPQGATIAAGIGLAAIVTGTIFGLAELHDRGLYGATVQTDTARGNFVRGLGERNGTISDVLDIVGVAGLGAAAAIWLWPPSLGKPTWHTAVYGTAAPIPGGGMAVFAGSF